jgi:hypothetical protein
LDFLISGERRLPHVFPTPNFGAAFLFSSTAYYVPNDVPSTFFTILPLFGGTPPSGLAIEDHTLITIGGPGLDAERGNYNPRVPLSFIQHKSLEIVCSLEVNISVIHKVPKEG